MSKKIDKNISKHLSSKYSQKCHDFAKKSATGERKTIPKIAMQKYSRNNWQCNW